MRIIAFILAILILSGCGTVETWKERRKNKTNVTETRTTTTEITETIDTSITIKSDSVVAIRPLDDLIKGKPIEARDGNNTVRVIFDSGTGMVRAVGTTEARNIPVKAKKIVKTNDQKAIKTKSKEVVTEQTKEKPQINWGLIIFLLMILLMAGVFLFRRARDGLIRRY